MRSARTAANHHSSAFRKLCPDRLARKLTDRFWEWGRSGASRPIAVVHKYEHGQGMLSTAFLLLMATGASTLVDHPRTYLLSIKNISLSDKQYISGFAINTFGVTALAACQIPPGWTLTTGSSADPSGKLAGEASLGVTYINKGNLDYLTGIALVRLYGPVQKRVIKDKTGELPATFNGYLDVGIYGNDIRGHRMRVASANIRLVSATRCPLPRF